MKNIYSNIYNPNLKNLKKAKKIIENNNLIGLPTETVYGLAGNAYSNISTSKIFNLKKRPTFNPLIVHFKNLNDLKNDVILNENFIKLYKAFCPGPITFILKKNIKSKIVKKVTAGKNTVAIRIPKHNITRKFLNILKVPLAAPSANISSKLSPVCAQDVFDEFKNKIKFILDGGRCKIGLESTIIDLTNKPTVLRP
jgi:L-threonylcarbamoyladenylate synthase